MAEDRMLSDEILLGLIKSNGGGGGGGTTNYNQLENKPQIGGVTLQGNKTASDLGLATETELADKADKSAVKNEFLGTLEEWNALTTEQKKAYDTYQIKGDYTEGSGGLPDYSTTEQKTGQKWIDGKDIYRKVFVFENVVQSTATQQAHNITGLDKVVKLYGVAITASSIRPLPYVDDAADYQRNIYVNDTNVCINGYTHSAAISSAYVVLEYTKTT